MVNPPQVTHHQPPWGQPQRGQAASSTCQQSRPYILLKVISLVSLITKSSVLINKNRRFLPRSRSFFIIKVFSPITKSSVVVNKYSCSLPRSRSLIIIKGIRLINKRSPSLTLFMVYKESKELTAVLAVKVLTAARTPSASQPQGPSSGFYPSHQNHPMTIHIMRASS